MIRTNSKKAKENIFSYIKDHSTDFLSDNYGIEASDGELYTVIWSIFEKEARPHDGRNAKTPLNIVFEEWASGLAMGSLFDFWYNRPAVDDLAAILEETPEEAAKYTESDAEKMLTRLIYREISAAALR